MAATVTAFAHDQVQNQSIGSLRGTFITITLATNDYVTGGIDFSSQLPAGTFIGAVVVANTGAGNVVQVPVVDDTNKKLLLLIGAAGVNVQAANGSSTAQVVTILAFTA